MGVGWKDGEYSIRVHTKELPSTLSVAPLILDGYPVEVVETGVFTAFSSDHYGKWRPVPGGVSVSPSLWGSGTIATTVYDSDEFTVKVAETLKDACDLLEAGFDYVTDMDGKKLFRKRK